MVSVPAEAPLRGTWCSGITSAPHAEGPGFKSQCVQSFAAGDAWAGACSVGMHLGLRPQLQHPELASGKPSHVRGSQVGAQMPSGKPATHQDITSYPVPAAALPRGPSCPPWPRGVLARHGAITLRRLAHTTTIMTTTKTPTLMLNTGAAARTCDNVHNAAPHLHAQAASGR